MEAAVKFLFMSFVIAFLSLVAYAANRMPTKRGTSDMCFDVAERVAMYTLEQTNGSYGFTAIPSEITSATAKNPDGSYTFSFGTSIDRKDSSLPTYKLSFHLNSKSQTCQLKTFAMTDP
jgi:hypothetical protein